MTATGYCTHRRRTYVIDNNSGHCTLFWKHNNAFQSWDARQNVYVTSSTIGVGTDLWCSTRWTSRAGISKPRHCGSTHDNISKPIEPMSLKWTSIESASVIASIALQEKNLGNGMQLSCVTERAQKHPKVLRRSQCSLKMLGSWQNFKILEKKPPQTRRTQVHGESGEVRRPQPLPKARKKNIREKSHNSSHTQPFH